MRRLRREVAVSWSRHWWSWNRTSIQSSKRRARSSGSSMRRRAGRTGTGSPPGLPAADLPRRLVEAARGDHPGRQVAAVEARSGSREPLPGNSAASPRPRPRRGRTCAIALPASAAGPPPASPGAARGGTPVALLPSRVDPRARRAARRSTTSRRRSASRPTRRRRSPRRCSSLRRTSASRTGPCRSSTRSPARCSSRRRRRCPTPRADPGAAAAGEGIVGRVLPRPGMPVAVPDLADEPLVPERHRQLAGPPRGRRALYAVPAPGGARDARGPHRGAALERRAVLVRRGPAPPRHRRVDAWRRRDLPIRPVPG